LEEALISRFKYEVLFRDSTLPAEGLPILSSISINIPTGDENECNAHPRLVEDSIEIQMYESCKLNIEYLLTFVK
jgi:hypothetical protein